MPKKLLVFPEGTVPTQFVSFLAGVMCGTITRHGIIIKYFNGLTKKEFAREDENVFARIMNNSIPPHSREPHAFVSYHDEVIDDEQKAWIPLKDLTFLEEDQFCP